ncbi:MAG: chemotaxis protein CheX [Smithellaceae bacterium]
MNVKFINPFLYGTAEVLEKMAFIKPVPGKPFAKTDDTAQGDVSGIIGMTGDAIGSLALTFDEASIIYITNKMLNENHTEINKEVLSTVGEITNMISGASRKLMEKDNLKVFAAIPTIVFGKGHTVRHIVKGPSIVIPFQTEKGTFVIDVCLKSQIKQKEEQPASVHQKPFDPKIFDPKAAIPAVFGKPRMAEAGPEISQAKIEQDLGRRNIVEHKDIGERLAHLKQILAETNATRDGLVKQLKQQPFMEWTQRQRYKKALPAYDAKIKRLKLDIAAAETIAKMSREDFENPTIKPHFQHYPATKPENK